MKSLDNSYRRSFTSAPSQFDVALIYDSDTSAWCIYDLKGEGMHNFRNLVLGELG